jgi:uncharacterized protein YegP (UPF0339 family)
MPREAGRRRNSMYFTIRKNQDGKYWWRAVGDNNEIMGYSELMNSKRAVEDAIETIIDEAGDAEVHDRTDKVTKRS